MVRKMLACLLLMLLMLPCTALADTQVIDNAMILSADEETEITGMIDRIEKEHQVDLVVLTANDVPTDYSDSLYRVMRYADDYYDNGGYGMGPDDSGLLFLIDMNNRVMWISTGGVMIDYINDYREEAIFDAVEGSMRYGQYGQAVKTAVRRIGAYMDEGRMEGTFRYDEATGKRLTGMYNALTRTEMLVALLAGVAVAAVFVVSVTARYNLKGSTYSYSLNDNATCTLTKDDEQFIRNTVTRTPRNTGSGSRSGSGGRSGGFGSGVHRSSGGRTHGGGGRRF